MDSETRCRNSRCTAYGVTVQCKLVLVLVLIAILPAAYTETRGPSSDFAKHTLVRPRVYHGRNKRQISSTKENDIDHVDVLTIGLTVDGVERVLDLRLNTDLIPVGYQQRYQHRGTYKVHAPSKVELCHYQGSVRDVPGSWVALSTCRGLRGVIFDGENLHHIQPEDESLDSSHYLYGQKDLVANHTCGYDGTPHHVLDRDHLELKRRARLKRAAEVIRGPYNANRQSRYVELVFVIDKKEYMALDENLDKVYHHCKDIANIINALYMPLNIFIALIGVQVWTDTDEIALSPNGDTTLSNFLRYRREKLVQEIPNDNAQLLTRIQFEGGVVGKALKGPICTYEFSGGVSMDHSSVVGLVAATVAHEMGHNFGMEHDSADCECPEEKCIMASSSGSSGPTHWSSCSLEHLALAFEHGMDYCLRNKPRKLFDSPICGNGFVEPGEQCDCGLKENCDNPCCNVTTCMLHGNASCATGECCDLKTCRPKTAGTECRSAEHECDLPEYCTGQSEYCPVDVFKMDGEGCSMGKAFCYQGSCRTHNDQCKLLWGPTGTSSDSQCYDMNKRGTKHGNCGYNRVESSYVKCTDRNLLCGMLHCKHLNERLEFGMESVAILSHSFINNGGKIIPCRSAIVDLGLNQVDPGLAPDGAKCAPGKMCVNQKCMPVADLRASVSGGRACPNDCGGNGVCNSLGHCHCNPGFRPPDCTQPGVGGSEDSGPAEDPNAKHDYVTALYIVFLGVIPMMALSSCGVWYVKNSGQHWKKGVMSTTDRGHNGLSIKTIGRSSPMPRNIETIDSNLSQDPACASLLPKPEADERYNNNFFGHFMGFTITPIKGVQSKLPEPTKPAPPPPTIPTIAINTNPKPKLKPTPTHHAPRNTLLIVTSGLSDATSAPALPPLNPGCTARPLISSPVLAATTCTSVELAPQPTPQPAPQGVSQGVPTRPAPPPPLQSLQRPQRPTSTPLTNVILPEVERKPDKCGGTLNRIASILRPSSGIVRSSVQATARPEEKSTNSLPRNRHQKASKVADKEILRSLEISNPIPQTEIEIPAPAIPVTAAGSREEAEKRNVVLRAQSMRDSKVTPRPAIHTFGSMRQPTPVKRPTSIPASTRPTSPPPGPPKPPPLAEKTPEVGIKIPGLPGYQNPPVRIPAKPMDNAYDDCMNLATESALAKIAEESPSSDNIYAVIEESIPEKGRKQAEAERQTDSEYKLPKRVEAGGGNPTGNGLDSMGLLSEIVSEISNRNFDSIYSTSTLGRKRREKEEKEASKGSDGMGSDGSLGGYMNSNHYKSPGSIYSNSTTGKFNSSSSTTSSGYLHPSALNVPGKPGAASKPELERSAEQVSADGRSIDKTRLTSLNSSNPNVNDEMSKELGMKPPTSDATYKPVPSTKSRALLSSSTSSRKQDEKQETKMAVKAPLSRTKTPPTLVKSPSKEAQENVLKSTRQSSEATAKSAKQCSESGPKSPKQDTDANAGTVLRSRQVFSQSKSAVDPSANAPEKEESRTNITGVSLKSVPCSTKDNLGKFNSPDVVSSCSNSNQSSTKSPDVLANNPKCTVGSKAVQRTPTLQRVSTGKTPSAPLKPLGIASKPTTVAGERKKSPSGNANPAKPLPGSTRETSGVKMAAPLKVSQRVDVKSADSTSKGNNPVQRAASGKSNVASLQQKFEAQKVMGGASKSIGGASKKMNAKPMEATGAKK